MSYYLFKASYTAAAMKTMVEQPQDRSKMISSACEAFGGKLIQMFMVFGDDDVIVIDDTPPSLPDLREPPAPEVYPDLGPVVRSYPARSAPLILI